MSTKDCVGKRATRHGQVDGKTRYPRMWSGLLGGLSATGHDAGAEDHVQVARDLGAIGISPLHINGWPRPGLRQVFVFRGRIKRSRLTPLILSSGC